MDGGVVRFRRQGAALHPPEFLHFLELPLDVALIFDGNLFLHFTKQGAGPPLLLLHGNGEDGSYFVHQMGAFSLHYTVYAIDTRGHGLSPRGDGVDVGLLYHQAQDFRVLPGLGAGLGKKGRGPVAQHNRQLNPELDPGGEQVAPVENQAVHPVPVGQGEGHSHTLQIAGSLPLGRLEIIVGDHFIAAKNPDAFNEAVAAFLADRPWQKGTRPSSPAQ